MTVRANLSVCFTASSGPVENKDLGHVERSDKIITYDEAAGVLDTVAAGAVNQPLNLGGLTTCELLCIVTYPVDQNQAGSSLNFRRNLITAEQIEVKPIGPRKQGYFLLSTSNLTALFVSNPGTTAMRVQYLALGA